MDNRASDGTRRIVVLGGGFGGVYTAHELERRWRKDPSVRITLISRNNYFLMTPLLFEAGSGVLEPRHAVNPIRPLFGRAEFIEAEIESVDFDARTVRVRQSDDDVLEVGYDQLVLAVGGVTNRRIVLGSEHALTFKTLADAIFLRNLTIELFERADVERDPERKRALLTFVIVGAGLVGVELMGEMTEFTRRLTRTYRRIDQEDLRFELLEAGPRIMPELDETLASYAHRTLEKRGVRVRVGQPVSAVESTGVRLEEGKHIRAETVIVATGVTPAPLVSDLGIETDRKGRVLVDATMRSRQHDNVWALGDCAAIPTPDGGTYPALAQHALRQARQLAKNLTLVLRGQAPQPFVYESMGTLAALGHYNGVGRVGFLRLRGFLAWWVWRTYYLFQMPRWDRRLRIVTDWTVALFLRNDVAKLDLFGETHPARHLHRLRREGPVVEPVRPPSPGAAQHEPTQREPTQGEPTQHVPAC